MINGAQAVVRVLSEQGVTQLFGYPGGAIMPIYDALYDSSLTHLLCRHEQGAAFAAVGYARASGKVGVCMATSGPGATNLVTALADAMIDSVPIVAITGQVANGAIGTDAFQEIDVLGLSLACTKHSFLVQSADSLCETLHQAFELATEGRPGPVVVDIPKDIQQSMLQYKPKPQYSNNQIKDNVKLETALTMIKQAKKPLLYIGGGVGMANAVSELRDFIQITSIPSVVTLKGIGAVSFDTSSYLGMLGMHGNRAANSAVQECDLLIAVGARFDDRVTGRFDSFAPKAKILHLDIDSAKTTARHETMLSYTGDLKGVLPALATPLAIDEWRAHCEMMKMECAPTYNTDGETIHAPSLLKRLSERLPPNTIVACDVGQHQMWVAQNMRFDAPENHISSGGFGTMGFGLPVAIGAQISRPDDLTVLVSGDGSFMMNVQELTTIKRSKAPIKIMLLDNQRLGMVKQWQEIFFDNRFSETDLSDNPDFVALAAAFDIPGQRIWRQDQIEQAIDQLLNASGAYFLHVSIQETQNVWPIVPPGASLDQMMEETQ